MEIINTNAVYIPSLDGKDIYISNSLDPKNGYRLKNKTGNLNLSRFINSLDYSLDLIKMRQVHKSLFPVADVEQLETVFSFDEKGNEYDEVHSRGKEYSCQVINVTFKYSNKEFNRVRGSYYIRFGYRIDDLVFDDCIAWDDGEIVGVQTGEKVNNPVDAEELPYFIFKDGMYRAKDNIKTCNNVADIRSDIYENGFVCEGIKYVRFKRSSGSSRVGKCLFINERLYNTMHEWEMCGIQVKEGQDIDLAALEPYIALTLSSIIDTIEIKPENILVVDDYKSVFHERAIATRLVDGRLVSKPEDVEISNSIWDGQSLMDRSLFGEYSNKGMLLLRARFFKSCCFNANIQQWFADHGIKKVSQLNGYTRAKKIEDVKLITTPSSIKYLKFGTLDHWLDTLETTFGVVKYEKKTHFFDGRMVQTHYQLINTLQMTYEEVEQFIKPSLDYARMIKTDPAVLRHQISYQYQSPDDTFYTKAVTSKNDIIYRLLGMNDRFAKTKMYRNFCNDLIKSFIKNLRCGHVLVRGNYSTLCGNPIEMLKMSIGQFDGSSIIERDTVHCEMFESGKELLGSRSPHVTIGNILVTRNVIRPEIARYMNPTNEIVYVNSIQENLLERLSGADFDSDTMLLTDNEILVTAAKRNYDNFPVPTKLVESAMRNRRYTNREKADLDIKTSVNKIGEIINLSQELNSILWDRINKGASVDDVMELYCDISQLDVMSNLEIDSAKRENPANNTRELQLLKKKYDVRDKKNRHVRPLFFKYIDGYKGYRDDYHVYLRDEDYCYKILKTDSYSEAHWKSGSKTEDIENRFLLIYNKIKTAYNITRSDEKQVTELNELQKQIAELFKEADVLKSNFNLENDKSSICDKIHKLENKYDELIVVDRGRMTYQIHETSMDYLQKCINKFRSPHLGKNAQNEPLSYIFVEELYLEEELLESSIDTIIESIKEMKRLINSIWQSSELTIKEKRFQSEIARNDCIEKVHNVPLNNRTMLALLRNLETEYKGIRYSMLYVLFEEKNGYIISSFHEVIQTSVMPVYVLEECQNGNISIYDFRYRKVVAEKEVDKLNWDDQTGFAEELDQFITKYKINKSWLASQLDITENVLKKYILGITKELSKETYIKAYSFMKKFKASMDWLPH